VRWTGSRKTAQARHSARVCREIKLEMWDQNREGGSHGENEETPSQQLKQAKLAISELYQENRELK
jgi:hypothetical protein